MRDIKFRAWNKDKKIMCFDDEDNSSDYWDGCVASFVGLVNYLLKDKDDYIWMQYTGLKDKNGTEIYEGDIVDDQFDCGQFRRIYYSDHLACFTAEHINTRIKKYKNDPPNYSMELSISPKSTTLGKVIGNIHENPELLLEERE